MISKSPKVLYFFGAYLRLFFCALNVVGHTYPLPHISFRNIRDTTKNFSVFIFQKHSGRNKKILQFLSFRNARHTSSKLPSVFFFQKYSGSIKKLHGILPCISFRNIRYKFLESLLHLSLRRSQQKNNPKKT